MKPETTAFPLPAPAFEFAGFTWPRYVANLPRGAKAERLDRYKKPVVGPYYHAPKPEQAGTGKGFYLASRCAPFALRWSYADEVRPQISHRGWFCDEFQDDKIRGLVFTLPHSRGFLAGWTMGEGMASEVDSTIYATADEAARAADALAETTADAEWEYREADADDDE
jgi:hypothetical protein